MDTIPYFTVSAVYLFHITDIKWTKCRMRIKILSEWHAWGLEPGGFPCLYLYIHGESRQDAQQQTCAYHDRNRSQVVRTVHLKLFHEKASTVPVRVTGCAPTLFCGCRTSPGQIAPIFKVQYERYTRDCEDGRVSRLDGRVS